MCYVSFFPQLMASPIIRYSHFYAELIKDKFLKINHENLSLGTSIIIFRLIQKVVLADTAGFLSIIYIIKFITVINLWF